MIRSSCIAAALALTVAAASPSTVAAQQQAHVHGQASIDVAIEGGSVEILLRAPAQDLVGFERAPATLEEEARLLAAREALLDHARLWRFSVGARCVAEGPTIDLPGAKAAEAHEGHDHGHRHNEHGDHSDWQARYRFRCAAPEALRAIEASLFEAFPSLQSVGVQLVDERGARAETLTPARRRLVLAR